jgi:hypothetical protein
MATPMTRRMNRKLTWLIWGITAFVTIWLLWWYVSSLLGEVGD